jgi:hypothetical protein
VLQRGSHATELAREPNVPYDRADIRGTTVVASKRAPASEAAVMLARADRTCATEVSFGASNDYYDREVGSARIGSRGVTWVTNVWSIEEDGSQRRAADVDLGVPSQGCRVDRGPRWSVMAQFGLAPPDCPEGTLDAPGCGLTDAAADRGSLFVATLGIWQIPAYAR